MSVQRILNSVAGLILLLPQLLPGQVTISPAKDGRSFSVTTPCLTGFAATWSATIIRDKQTNVVSSVDGVREGDAIRFGKEGVELLFRVDRPKGGDAVFAQAGIRNTGTNQLSLVAIMPVNAEFGVAGELKDWLVTGLHPMTPVLVALSDITRSVDVFEYGSLYRGDGNGFLIGPVGEPIAYLGFQVAAAGGLKRTLTVRADMSGVRVDPGETRWGQQVALVMEPPQAALAKWAEWVAESHHALTNKGALCGWNNWNTLGQATKGDDVLAVADQVLHSDGRLRPSVIQIDAGYLDENGKAEDKERFPDDPEVYARRIARTGARPGLLVRLGWPSGLAAWTAQVPHVRQAVEQGFTYLKIQNSLFPSVNIVADPKLTSFQVIREGAAKLREAAGPETYLVYRGAQIPERAVVGLADACRVGNNSFRKQLRSCPKEVLRSQQFNGRWFAVDYDAYYIGTDIANISVIAGGWPLVRTWMSMVGLSCGTAITSDMWHEERFKPFWRNVEVLTPPARERVEVLDLGLRRDWPRLVGHVRRGWGDWTVALLWNPRDKEQSVTLRFPDAGMVAGHRYAVWSFWDDRYMGVVQDEWTTPRLAASGSQLLCFTDLDDHASSGPALIGSDLHIWCGAAEVKRVESRRTSLTVELTDVGARDGALFVYSRYQPVLRTATGCAVSSVDSAGENVWRVNLRSRQREAPQKIELALILPVTHQVWSWLLVATAAGSLLFAAWRYVVSLRLQRVQVLADERVRIARDLHDEVGANLTRIAIMTEDRKSGDEDEPARMKMALTAVRSLAREMTMTIDEIVWALNPKHDTLESVVNYLCGYAGEYLEDAGLRVRLDIPLRLPMWPVTTTVRHNLLLAFKEALNNVVKHAGAREVCLMLKVDSAKLCLVVRDDGRGLSNDPGRPAGGNGLDNMRNRMAALGGDCRISSVPGGGTTLEFEVPVASLNRGA